MTIALDLAFEQERLEQQSDIAEDLHLTGITHGYFMHPKVSADYEYLLGYIEGLMQYNEDLSRQIKSILAAHPQAELEDCPF